MMPSMIAETIHVHAHAAELVRGVSLAASPGEALTIVGETGSGKSLLAEAIMGTLPPTLRTSGRVTILGRSSSADDVAARRSLWGRHLSLLPQEPWLSLDPTMRVARQVREVRALVHGDDHPTAAGRADTLLRRLGLDNAAARFPFAISGGMAQRVTFAATRVGDAPILIVDEPTKGLDIALRDRLVSMLQSALTEGCTILTITHDLAVARALGGRIAVMLDGVFVEEGRTHDVLTAPQHAYTRRLIDAEPAHWQAFGASVSGAPAITATGLSKSFGQNKLFSNLDLTLAVGERVAITGPSGSGKTTLGNVMLGLVRPDAGHVERMAGISPHRFQKLYQDPPAAFPPSATLRTVLGDVLRRHGLAWGDVTHLMPRLKLGSHLLDRRPDEVSGGELQRFALLRALLVKPVALLADEPTSRLDPITQQETMAVLIDTTIEQQIALILVTHDPDIATKSCSRVVKLTEP
jgi:peptide/nickel transport system ATP-binding protein